MSATENEHGLPAGPYDRAAMLDLIVIVVLFAAVLIIKRYRQQMIEDRLRKNPPPRRVIQVCLPREISDSRSQMRRFYKKAASAALGGPAERKTGVRQIDFVFHGEVQSSGASTLLRCLIYADEDKMDSVKRAIKNSYEGRIEVSELPAKDDPMAKIAAELRPPEPAPTENAPSPDQQLAPSAG